MYRCTDAINGAGSYNCEREELTVLCEEALQKCMAGITVCMSDGNRLWKDKRDQWDSK
jgi:hypothetical protein